MGLRIQGREQRKQDLLSHSLQRVSQSLEERTILPRVQRLLWPGTDPEEDGQEEDVEVARGFSQIRKLLGVRQTTSRTLHRTSGPVHLRGLPEANPGEEHRVR